MRRVQSDRFDQIRYERDVALLSEANDQVEGSCPSVYCGSSEDIGMRDRVLFRGREVLHMDEEQRVVRRVLDRSALMVR